MNEVRTPQRTQGRDALLGLLLVELAVRVLGLGPDLLDALLHGLGLLAVGDDGRFFLPNHHALARAEHLGRDRF